MSDEYKRFERLVPLVCEYYNAGEMGRLFEEIIEIQNTRLLEDIEKED